MYTGFMKNVTQLPNVPGNIEQTVRRVASNTSAVRMTGHASEQMVNRELTMTQVYRCLVNGQFIEGPTLDSYVQVGWKFTMEILSAGVLVKVAGKLVEEGNGYILVITVMG